MNPKIEKIRAEIEKSKEKALFWTEKTKTLEKRIEQIENEEIITLFREKNLSTEQFAALLNAENIEKTKKIKEIPNEA